MEELSIPEKEILSQIMSLSMTFQTRTKRKSSKSFILLQALQKWKM